ncbi:DUF4333 domain-containing protein [Pseudonocardia sp. GCM10023141]|uniref:DUF4333 domain-containing protein n=1 Tax=Pseudonocardia sp. GCM10023141 TaxID=3252653 RepID=UPI0036063C6D
MNGSVRLVRFGRQVAVLGAAVAVLLGTSACSGSVPKDRVASSIADLLKQKGLKVDNDVVTCPADLKAEVGQSTRCEFVTDGQPVDVVAKVSSVQGDTANYDITTEARPVLKSVLEKTVGTQVGQKAGVPIDKTECAGDLPPQVGQSTTCTVSGGGETVKLKVSVTTVDGGQVNFSIDPA